MNTKGLSLNTIPPVSVPLRFFLTAPLFGIFAALLILYNGPQIWTSRWQANSLALTHLLTIGFMLMVMMGALYQFIPVMLGRLIPGGRKMVMIIHTSLLMGTLFIVSGFLSHSTIYFWTAFFFLGISLSLFAVSLLPLLITELCDHLIVYLVRILFIVLLVTAGLGLFMLFIYAYPDSGFVFRQYTDIHAVWGLIGWVVILIMAVSSQVIPMFFVTPEFSVRYLKILSMLIVVILSTMSLSTLLMGSAHDLFSVILSMGLIFFSGYTLLLINQRKRKLADMTINFWRLSLLSMLLVISYWWLLLLQAYFFQDSQLDQIMLHKWDNQAEFTVGILLIYGFALSAIIGMLQKIVPFLLYLNLQNSAFKHPESMSVEPKLVLNMKQIITNRQSKIQFLLHGSSLLLLIVSVYWPQLVWFAGLAMLANFVWLSFVLFKGFHFFNKNKRIIVKFPEMKMDFVFNS